jgi:hypothetical protein
LELRLCRGKRFAFRRDPRLDVTQSVREQNYDDPDGSTKLRAKTDTI